MPHVGTLKYHIVWCTKYRRKVLTDIIQIRLKELITEKCKQNNYPLIEVETMPEHIQVFVGGTSKDSVHRIVSQLKGYTSFKLKREFTELTTRLPNLWTRSYYADSIGNATHEAIHKYIQNQKKQNSSQA